MHFNRVLVGAECREKVLTSLAMTSLLVRAECLASHLVLIFFTQANEVQKS
jgi:hypothetical protein